MRCPICNREFLAHESKALPFCSERCRRIDLGRWLGEDYGVPVEHEDEDETTVEENGGRADSR